MPLQANIAWLLSLLSASIVYVKIRREVIIVKQISLLIKPASSLCNMRCAYCFYEDVSANRECASMGIMDRQTTRALIDRTMCLDVNQINYCFQGGEPTVAGIDYFKDFIDYVDRVNTGKKITYAIQTNATLLDDAWIELFSKHDFLVGVSLDGFLENHNRLRKDAAGKGTFKIIMSHIKKMKKAGIHFNILTVLSHQLSKKPEQLFEFYQKNDLNYIQLIPCLPTLEGNARMDQYALTPHDFADFYCTFFDLWYQAYMKGHYMSVTLFDNLIPMYLNVLPSQCGMLGQCHMQLVVEANGNVYPCDFYVLDDYCCGNINTDSLQEIMKHEAAKRFLKEKRVLCKACDDCPFYHMCYGNCRRLSVCYYDAHYCGYKTFLTYSQEKMRRIAQMLTVK